MATAGELLDRWLDPISEALNPEAARRLVSLRADDEMQQRVDELADRNTEGLITPEERFELEAFVAAAELMAIMQAKARNHLAAIPTAAA